MAFVRAMPLASIAPFAVANYGLGPHSVVTGALATALAATRMLSGSSRGAERREVREEICERPIGTRSVVGHRIKDLLLGRHMTLKTVLEYAKAPGRTPGILRRGSALGVGEEHIDLAMIETEQLGDRGSGIELRARRLDADGSAHLRRGMAQPSPPRSGFGQHMGFFWWEIDISYSLLKLSSWVGLVWDLRLPPRAALAANRVADGYPDVGMLALAHWMPGTNGSTSVAGHR